MRNGNAAIESRGVKSAKTRNTEPTRVIEPELMTREEQAEHLSSLYSLRGSAMQIDGAAMKLRGLMMCSNAHLKPARVEAACDELQALLNAARAELKRLTA